jgi:hypothetical protein
VAFTIRNAQSSNDPQASPDKVDFDILVQGVNGEGVVSGCAVTAQGSPDMTVAVASGVVRIAGITASVTAGNVTIGAAHGSLPRFDLITVNTAGSKANTAGTANANPVYPSGGAAAGSSIVLAAVYVPAADTTIGATQIEDKRVILPPAAFSLVDHATPTGTTETVDLALGNVHRMRWDANLTISVSNVPSGFSRWWLMLYHDNTSSTYTLNLWAGVEYGDDAAGLILPASTANAEVLLEIWSFNGTSFRIIQGPNYLL